MGPRRNPRRNPRRKEVPGFPGRRDRPGELPRVEPTITSDAHEVFLANLEADRLKLVNDHQTMRIKELETDLEEAQNVINIQQATIVSQERTVKSSMRTCNFQAHRMQRLIARDAKNTKMMNRVLQMLAKTSGVALHPVATFVQRVARSERMEVPLSKSPEAVESDPEENVVRSV
ncbi:hypothetical protein CJU89_5639 [Yarrowia sp. B02]|nr:hypothetical protein CJU89_5639 [Yarrowia sp. B02]